MASDGGTPSKTATCLVNVNVNRNLHRPSFINPPKTQEIPEITLPGTVVMQVSAADNDTSVSQNQSNFKLKKSFHIMIPRDKVSKFFDFIGICFTKLGQYVIKW